MLLVRFSLSTPWDEARPKTEKNQNKNQAKASIKQAVLHFVDARLSVYQEKL
jgi:hypothetical protein